ncbi:MAG TPA: hypothetical protein VFO85_14080, partial [Vicinamibacteria bacterium]|nr:hypothetical protein [Vicinamibacteria bacterium]
MRTRVALAAALLCAAPALAQLPAGTEFQVNTYTPGTQYRPSAAVLRFGEYVVVWDSMLQDGSWLGVYGQRFAPTGAPIGAEFRVNTYTTNFQWDCHVAGLPGGESVVVFFSDQAPDGTYARLYDNTGAPRGPEFRVQTSAPYGLHPAVAADARGTFVVAWEGMGDGSERGVFARRFGRLGQPLGPEFLVNTYTTARQSAPEVAMAADGAFTIFWSSLLAAGTDPEVRGQRYDRQGAPLGGEFAVNTYTTGWQYGPQADSDRAGNVIVAWSSLNQDGSSWGVYAQRYDAAGAALGGEFRVNVATADRQAFQTVASDGNFNFVVVWETGSYGLALRGRRYDSAGAPRGGEVPVGL